MQDLHVFSVLGSDRAPEAGTKWNLICSKNYTGRNWLSRTYRRRFSGGDSKGWERQDWTQVKGRRLEFQHSSSLLSNISAGKVCRWPLGSHCHAPAVRIHSWEKRSVSKNKMFCTSFSVLVAGRTQRRLHPLGRHSRKIREEEDKPVRKQRQKSKRRGKAIKASGQSASHSPSNDFLKPVLSWWWRWWQCMCFFSE